jgi:hypothetical protein
MTNLTAGWVAGVQTLQCLALISFMAALTIAIIVNFVKRSPNINNRYLEFTVIFAGLWLFSS